MIKFRLHIHELEIDYPKDCLIKKFMLTLEKLARFWYEDRPPASISSIKDFYLVFCKRFGKHHLPLELIEALCGDLESLILYLGNAMDGEELMDCEIKEALVEFNSQSSCSSEDSVLEPCVQEEYV